MSYHRSRVVSPAAPVDQLVIFVPRRNGDALLGFEVASEFGIHERALDSPEGIPVAGGSDRQTGDRHLGTGHERAEETGSAISGKRHTGSIPAVDHGRPLGAVPQDVTAPSRNSDPSTSHAAGAEQVESGRAAAHAWIVLAVLKSASEPLTYREVHKRCVDRIAEAAEVQKRLDSLRTAGLAETAPDRKCTVTLREVQTWRAK